MNHLKEKSHYSNLYDKFTVNRCKKIISDTIEQEKKEDKPGKINVRTNIYEFYIAHEKINSALKKEETIRDWMDRDLEIDNFINSKKIPKIICNTCSKLMNLEDNIFKDGFGKEKDRVIYKFSCKGCNQNKVIYDNGEERIIKKSVCPDCKIELSKSTKVENETLIITSKCNHCDYKIIDDFDLREEVSPDFEKERKLYCIPEEEAHKIQNGIDFFYDEINSLVTGQDKKTIEKLENERKYKPLEAINRMNLKQLEKYLEPIFKKQGFTNFNFLTADVDREIKVYYTVFDDTGIDNTYDSNKIFRKLLKTSLVNTNWLLMDSGRLENKLGIIKGRLKGIDDNDELLKLLESNNKKKK